MLFTVKFFLLSDGNIGQYYSCYCLFYFILPKLYLFIYYVIPNRVCNIVVLWQLSAARAISTVKFRLGSN